MNFIDEVEEFTHKCWKSIFMEVHEAVVFIDSAATECLHWHTGDQGYLVLKTAGAFSVHELATYSLRNVKDNNDGKAVIISTSAYANFYEYIIKMIMEQNEFKSYTIITTVHYRTMNYDNNISNKEIKNYTKMKEDLQSFINSKNPLQNISIEIIYVPIFISLLTRSLFTTPPFVNLMPPIHIPDANKIKETELYINHFVSSLESLFHHLDIIEDIYSIGKCSDYIAETLKNLPAAIKRRSKLNGASGSRISLILIDRTLDLSAVTSHDTNSVLSRMLCILPHLPNHTNDIAVNMNPVVCESMIDAPFIEIPGCLATTDKNLIDILISKKQQAVLVTANHLLQSILTSKGSPKSKITTRVSVHSLEKQMYKFQDKNEIYSTLESSKQLQIIWAIVQSLKSDKNMQIELLLSIEKLISQNVAVSRDSSSVLTQLSNIIRTRHDRKLDTENLLALLIYVYALAGTEIHFSPAQEELLEESLSMAFYEDMKVFNESTDITNGVYQQILLLLGVTDDESAKEISMKTAKHFITMLHDIAKKREGLRNYVSLVSDPHPSEMVQYVGILEQLVKDIINPKRPKIHDLHATSMHSSISFNLFSKSKTEHHPADNPWILIYVVGGITPEESRKVQEIVSLYKTNCSITLAGSRLLNPSDIVNEVLLMGIKD
ncbi:sec1 family domain-containing protein 2-like isoform X1 [Vespa velutina]|uniref:sec1 family domain-containing protein 2-like isoform X1 n=2 Tax=Vespa velutina TaxID=202808 RepID=UPI001FB3A7D8|nr:sec1 family domain-containing protein 2-like isoform X1 [Vespa velutina]